MNARLLTRADCPYAVGLHAYVAPAEILRAAAARFAGDRDLYGVGESLAAFEGKIAGVLGKEAAVFMPSGTMAQQIALRIVADRSAIRGFAAHSTNHIVLHEHDGYARLHDLVFVAVGVADRLMTVEDIRAVREPAASLLLELPQREIGGELPLWADLAAVVAAARDRGWHVHLDGARLWECAPFYGVPYAEIGALFDTVYVSFYKGIGALAGAMLAGPARFIDEARVWQRRHGGNLVTLFPYAAIAEQAFDERIKRMAAYHQAAMRVAGAFGRYPQVPVRPRLPPTNMLHVFLSGTAADVLARAQRVAREQGVWTINRLGATTVPNVQRWEISCGDATLDLDDDRLRGALDGLLHEGNLGSARVKRVVRRQDERLN